MEKCFIATARSKANYLQRPIIPAFSGFQSESQKHSDAEELSLPAPSLQLRQYRVEDRGSGKSLPYRRLKLPVDITTVRIALYRHEKNTCATALASPEVPDKLLLAGVFTAENMFALVFDREWAMK
jgi:hypothetical protein